MGRSKKEARKYGGILTCTGDFTDSKTCAYARGHILGDHVADFVTGVAAYKFFDAAKKVLKTTKVASAIEVIEKVDNAIAQIGKSVQKIGKARLKKLSNGVSRLVVDGVGDVLEYTAGKMKVLVSTNSKWLTSTTGWTYVADLVGPHFNSASQLVNKGRIKVYKKICGGGSRMANNIEAARTDNALNNDACEIGFQSVASSIKEYFSLGSRKKGKSNHNPDIDKPRNSTDFLDADAIYHVDGFRYDTDGAGRVKKVTANDLQLNNGFRDREGNYQAQIEFQNKKDYDDGGHLIANWFRGPNEAINIVPMRKGLNRNVMDPTMFDPSGKGAWLQMEREWATALKSIPAKKVDVEMQIIYSSDANDRRPIRFIIDYAIEGEDPVRKSFSN